MKYSPSRGEGYLFVTTVYLEDEETTGFKKTSPKNVGILNVRDVFLLRSRLTDFGLSSHATDERYLGEVMRRFGRCGERLEQPSSITRRMRKKHLPPHEYAPEAVV